jgi:hypothetical protein
MAKNRFEQTTYYITGQEDGPSGGGPSGSNKAMLSILNPASSGKTVKIRIAEYFTIASTGTDVYIDVQLRRITAHSAGTSLTPIKRDTASAAAVAETRQAPNVTGGAASDIVQQLVIQSNSPVGGEGYRFRIGDGIEYEPLVLAEGEGVVVHQVTSNGGTFCPGLVWTEE